MNLNRKVGEMSYDGLITDLTPPVQVRGRTIRKLAVAATYARGTILAKSSVDDKLVILGTTAAGAVDAIPATYALTEDDAITAGKTYYTRSGTEGAYVYTAVASPVVGDIATYYEMATPGSPAVNAEVLVVDCILCDDTDVGTAEDINAAVYTAGCFDPGKVTVKDGYTITETDKDELRMRDIVFKAVSEAN